MKTKNHIRFLIHPFRQHMTILLFFGFISTVIEFGGPFVSRNYLSENPGLSLAVIGLSILVSGMISIGIIINRNRQGVFLKADLTKELCSDLLSLRYSSLIEKEPSFIYEKINMIVDSIADYYLEALPGFIISLFCIALCFGITIWIDWKVTIVFLCIITIQLFGYRVLNKRLSKMSRSLQNASASKYSAIISILSNTDYLKQLADHTPVLSIIKEKEITQRKVESNINVFAGGVSTLYDILLLMLSNAVYVYIPLVITKGWLSLQDSVLLVLVNTLFVPAAKNVVHANISRASMDAGISYVKDDILPFLEDNDSGLAHNSLQTKKIDEIHFDISRLMVDGKMILHSGMATIYSGDIVKIQGKTGSGKTCLMKSLVKFWPITSVLVNKQPIEGITEGSIREKICYVPQNSTVYSGSVIDNIRFGRDIPDFEEKISQTIFKKYLYGDIALDKMIVENGSNLSGGEKQKIGLARTLFEEWDVLILDESTSAMDSETEQEVLQYFAGFCQKNNKILFIISHSSSVDSFCNRTLQVENGTIKVIS